jgi:hypothetical protein
MQEGPWIPNLRNISKEYDGKLFTNSFQQKKPFISYRHSAYESQLSDEQKSYVQQIVSNYANATDMTMKLAAYKTEPMKYILAQEKKGRKMTRIPVLYKDTSVIDSDMHSKE